jgi:hypothetical protein
MSQSIPTPRDGATPVASSPTRPRPWPSTRRFVLPIVVAAAALILVPAGSAFACVTPPKPPTSTCDHGQCSTCDRGQCSTTKPTPKPSWTKPTPKPSWTKPVTPVPPSQTTTVTVSPAPTSTGGECVETSGSDTCHVVSGSPSFTG